MGNSMELDVSEKEYRVIMQLRLMRDSKRDDVLAISAQLAKDYPDLKAANLTLVPSGGRFGGAN